MRWRSTIRLLLPVAALLLTAVAVYVAISWNDPLVRAEARLTQAAVALQGGATTAALAEAARLNGYERAWIVDGSGRMLVSSRPSEAESQIEDPWAEILAGAASPTLFRAEPWGDRLMLFAAHRTAETGNWSAVLEDGTSIRRERWADLGMAGGAALLLFGLIAVTAHTSVHRRLTRPLGELAALSDDAPAGAAAPSDAIRRIAAGADRSVAALATTLDTLWKERDTLRRDLNERLALQVATNYLAGDMILIAMFDGRIVDMSRSLCRRLGVERDQVTGRLLSSLDPALPADVLRALGERSAREKRPFEYVSLTFLPREKEQLEVVAAVQAIPIQGEPAFVLIASERLKTADDVSHAGEDLDAADGTVETGARDMKAADDRADASPAGEETETATTTGHASVEPAPEDDPPKSNENS